MHDKISIIKLLGIPEAFAVVLLTFSFVLFLAPYFSGGDFGLFKIPQFTDLARKRLKITGPIIFLLLVLLFVPLITPSDTITNNQTDPDKITVLVADFKSLNEQNFGVTEKIIQQLRAATSDYTDISIQALGQVITEQQGSAVARAIGIKRQAGIVLWGWYNPTPEAVDISAYFEPLRPPKYLNLRQNLETQTLPISELNGFKVQVRLSGEMTYLTLLTIGLARYESDDYDGAIKYFTKALAQLDIPQEMVDPADLYFYRGAAYTFKARKDEIDQAIADYNKAIELNPNFALAYNNRGSSYVDKGQFERAIPDFDKAIQLMPDSAEFYFNRGFAYGNDGQFDQAITDFDKAIEINANLAEAYLGRGAGYGKKHRYDQAIADFDKAIELKHDYPEAYFNYGVVYVEKGETDRSIVYFDKAIEIKPDYAEAYLNRGYVYNQKGEIDRAIADFDKAIELKPENADFYHHRGSTYIHKGEYDRAIIDLDKAIQLKSDFAEAYLNRGDVYGLKGQSDRAIADFDKAIQLKPDFALAYYARAIAYQSKGKLDSAVSDVKTILLITTDPNMRQRAEQFLRKLEGK